MKALIALVSSASLVFASASAYAIETEQSGKCSSGSLWQADLELEYNVFDLSLEINTRKSDEVWKFSLRHNGKRVTNESRTAIKKFDDSYAEVEWDVIRPDRKGSDSFKFRAVNQVTGEVCRATLRA